MLVLLTDNQTSSQIDESSSDLVFLDNDFTSIELPLFKMIQTIIKQLEEEKDIFGTLAEQ